MQSSCLWSSHCSRGRWAPNAHVSEVPYVTVERAGRGRQSPVGEVVFGQEGTSLRKNLRKGEHKSHRPLRRVSGQRSVDQRGMF